MSMVTRTTRRTRWALVFFAAVLAVAVGLIPAGPVSALRDSAAQNAVEAHALAAGPLVGTGAGVSPDRHLETYDSHAQIASATSVAADTGAQSALSGVKLRAQLTGEEISGGTLSTSM